MTSIMWAQSLYFSLTTHALTNCPYRRAMVQSSSQGGGKKNVVIHLSSKHEVGAMREGKRNISQGTKKKETRAKWDAGDNDAQHWLWKREVLAWCINAFCNDYDWMGMEHGEESFNDREPDRQDVINKRYYHLRLWCVVVFFRHF